MIMTELCKAINLQNDIANEVLAICDSPDFIRILEQIKDARDKNADAEITLQQLYGILSPDESQNKMLTYMLHSALDAYNKYKHLGIPDDIYFATMRCFTRFINECYAKTGVYAFDRGFWTGRQVSLKLFRIGELEYEMTDLDGEAVISIHIPSDSDLSEEKCVESIRLAKDFFMRFFPAYSQCKYICDSWLLSPALKELLPKTSRIIGFQNMFDLVKTTPESMSFAEWVFQHNAFEFVTKTDETGNVQIAYQKKDIDFDVMPDNTSLQRNIKAYIKAGGQIGEGLGILKSNI